MRHVADRTSFMKIMIHDYPHQLQVPPQFVKHLGRRPIGEYQMRVWGSARSHCWIVKVERDGNEYFFRNGWPEFVEDNDLEFADVLVFGYEGKFKFLVKVFAPSGLKRNMPSLRGEEEEVAVETPLQDHRESEVEQNMHMDLDEQPIFYVNDEGECHVGAGGKRVKAEQVSMETSQEESLYHVEVGGEKEKEGLTCAEPTQKESLCCMELAGEKENEGHGCTEPNRKESVGCSDMKGEKEQGMVESTQTESLFQFGDKAKERTEEPTAPPFSPFSSSRTHFTSTWSPTWQHYMTIPKEIAAEKDLYGKSQLVVRDSKGKIWFMKLSVAEDGSVNLTEKWSSFYESHSLKEGDSCIFEFIGSRIVHVQTISSCNVKSHAGVEDVAPTTLMLKKRKLVVQQF